MENKTARRQYNKTLKAARLVADRAFNASLSGMSEAIKSGDREQIAKAYTIMQNALNRCNTLGLF